jgi:hypothetical protein
MRPLARVLLTAALLAIPSASAGAAVYCVPASFSCGGTGKPDLASAVTAASLVAGVDDILLAPGTFPASGVTANLSNPVHIKGSGRAETVIEGATSGTGLQLYGPDQRISDLTVHEPDHGHNTALRLDGGGVGTDIRVDQRENTDSSVTAISLVHGSGLVDSEALARTATVPVAYGVYVDNSDGSDSLITGLVASGGYAVDVTNGSGSATVRFAQLTGHVYGLLAAADSVLLEDSTVTGAPVVSYLSGGADDITTTVRHVTINGSYAGIESYTGGRTAHLLVSNTAIVGGNTDPETPDLDVRASAGATGILDADYSFFRADHALTAGFGGTETLTPGTHNVNGADAKLVALAAGDLRPRWDSPLVDKGDPVPGGGEPMADLAGGDRTVNGVTDIGAYEYGRHTPTLTVSAAPGSVLTGEGVTFSATVVDADPGELPVVTWAFDDGTTATGAMVSHAFTTAGTHTAVATATDSTGLSATAVAPVTVTAPFVPKAMAPQFGFKKLTAKGGAVRIRLSCPVAAANCKGIVRLLLAGKKTELGRARYSFVNGTSATVKVRLTKAARKRLRKARRGLRVKVVAKPAGAAANSKTVRLTGR